MFPTSIALKLLAPETDAPQSEPKTTSRHIAENTVHRDPSVWTFGGHCAELDGARGLAILLVTLYRFIKEWDPSVHWVLGISDIVCSMGARGVDLFFVLSGFLITGILLRTKSSPGYFRNFMARRALRIFPLYFSSLLVCLVAIPYLFGTQSFDLPRTNQIYLWTYTSNLYMAWTNNWCFGPLDHFWSLAVEEHFYLVWPLIVFCISSKALLRLSLGIVLVVGILRTAFAIQPEYGVAVDTLSLFRCDALALGAMLAVALKEGLSFDRVNRVAKWGLPLLGVVCVAVAISGKRWMGIPHTLFGCLWVLFLAVVVTRSRMHPLSNCLRASWLQWLGKYSYGMYVIQLPLVTLIPLSLFETNMAWMGIAPVFLSLAYVPILFAMTCLAAFASYHLLEKPFLKWKGWFA
jgi:peptidoglycan/LPS O-acetylase OafA/YrhL